MAARLAKKIWDLFETMGQFYFVSDEYHYSQAFENQFEGYWVSPETVNQAVPAVTFVFIASLLVFREPVQSQTPLKLLLCSAIHKSFFEKNRIKNV